MTKTHQTFGFEDASVTKPSPHRSTVILHSPRLRCNLVHSKVEEKDTRSPRIATQSQSPKGNVLISTCRRSMSLLRIKDSKKSGTILHAVPGTTSYATTLLYDQRDTTAQGYQNASCKAQVASANTSPTLTSDNASTTRSQSRNGSPASLNQPFHPRELKTFLSNTSLKGSIGTYKNGTIHWQQTEHTRQANDARKGHVAEKTSKPKIHVLIPGTIRERPLPALPFFETAGQHHSASASIHNSSALEVSPPSAGNKAIVRNSVVSPLKHDQHVSQPVSFGQFQRSMSRVVRKASVRPPRQRYPVSKPSGSSVDSHDSDSASTYSNGSSETSIEPDSPPLDPKEMYRYSVQNPVAAGVFDSPESCVRQFTPPLNSRPRQYAHHPPIEQDQAFQPTCPLRRSRNAPGALSRQSTMNRNSSKRSNRQRSLATNNGVIDRAISRSTSRQFSNPLRGASPTLSEAENELEEQLTFLKKGGEDAIVSKPKPDLKASPKNDSSIWSATEIQKTPIELVGPLPKNSIGVDMSRMPAPPAVPRKSSKRSTSENGTYRLSRMPRNHIASQMERGRLTTKNQRLTITIPEYKRIDEDVEPSPISTLAKSIRRIITPSCAESVILNIYRNLDNFDDLFATAVVNQGFYRVFKRHELDLIRSILKKMSPPAWEYREIAFPGHDMLHDEDLEMTRPQEEYTPFSYLHMQKRDMHIMRSIKTLIKEKCQSYIRPEMAAALVSVDRIETGRVDDALWRIWTFCKIFGSGKAREDDIIAQQDWLKGGPMVHQQTCTFSIMSTDYMNDTLISAPECFAKGNGDGLTAEQLFDMMELWGCLGALLHDFSDNTALRTAQARECGVYDKTEIRGGDIDGEESMLEEWCSYVLTFGLSAVLGLASSDHQESENPFKSATQQGWMSWNPPVFGSSRRYFLKEAASRVYEEKIARTYAANSTRSFHRQLSKERCQNHIAELRKRRIDTTDVPGISFSQERPMSEWSTVIGSLNQPLSNTSTESGSYIPRVRSALAQELTASIAELPVAKTPPPPNSRSLSPPRRLIAQPLLPTPPPSTVPSVRDRNSIAMSMPSIEEHPTHRRNEKSAPDVPSLMDHPAFRHQTHTVVPSNIHSSLHPSNDHRAYQSHSRQSSGQSQQSLEHPVFQQHPKQHGIFASAAHENTAEKAIYRIVDMGFTADEAKEALRMTDLGDGLKVGRAVELLLSRRR